MTTKRRPYSPRHTAPGEGFFKSQRYLRACELMGIHPFRNPNYREGLKAAGLWWKPRSEAERR